MQSSSASVTPSRAVQEGLLPHLCSGSAVFGLVLAGELIAFALVLTQSTLMTFSWGQLGYVSMIVQWITLLSALLLCRLSSVFSRLSVILAGGLAYSCVLLIALLVIMSALWLLDGYIDVLALVKHMMLAAIFSGIILRYLYIQQQLRHQQQAELQSRIQALHARIRPHFLFNSMNAVASLIPVNPELAEKVVEDLSQLFRVSLQEMSMVSLDEEIALCRSYTDIEHVRLGDRLHIDWQCQHSDHDFARDISVPSLVLQPLIENAIYHGIQRIVGGGVIHVATWVGTQCVFLRVTNPVPELVDNQTDDLNNLTDSGQSNRMALNNIQHRLHAHYGEAASIDVQQTRDHANNNTVQAVYQVTITIPMSSV